MSSWGADLSAPDAGEERVKREQELYPQRAHAASIADRKVEIQVVERANEDVHDTSGQNEDQNGVLVVPERMIDVVVSRKIVEDVVFDVPTGMSNLADRLGTGF